MTLWLVQFPIETIEVVSEVVKEDLTEQIKDASVAFHPVAGLVWRTEGR